jgi:S-disulfanyl-L-cysteine oxidoreductase SoxD
MSTLKPLAALALALVLVASTGAATAQTPGLGARISEADVAAWDISILPDGTGLPAGSGTAAQGAPIFAAKCAMCHGEAGKGSPAGNVLVGGAPLASAIETTKTIGNFWGYSTTVFDFIRRAMPFQQPRTLTDNEVYALTAYLLALNKIIGENEVMNAKTLPQVKMPNRDGFIIRFPDRI